MLGIAAISHPPYSSDLAPCDVLSLSANNKDGTERDSPLVLAFHATNLATVTNAIETCAFDSWQGYALVT